MVVHQILSIITLHDSRGRLLHVDYGGQSRGQNAELWLADAAARLDAVVMQDLYLVLSIGLLGLPELAFGPEGAGVIVSVRAA